MIKILCLVSNESEMLAIKKRIQDEIMACNELPLYQKWVRPGIKFDLMITENCEIDFRLPNPDKAAGLRVDLVYGVFDCDYSDEIVNMLTGKRNLGLRKKYGKSELPIWEIVLDIEKQYAKVTEGMFKKCILDMEKQYFIKHDSKPCSFCENFEEQDDENHIYKDEDGQFNIMADTGDPYQWGIIEDINYCPYCGRRLAND